MVLCPQVLAMFLGLMVVHTRQHICLANREVGTLCVKVTKKSWVPSCNVLKLALLKSSPVLR